MCPCAEGQSCQKAYRMAASARQSRNTSIDSLMDCLAPRVKESLAADADAVTRMYLCALTRCTAAGQHGQYCAHPCIFFSSAGHVRRAKSSLEV